jgi:putative membrane protein
MTEAEVSLAEAEVPWQRLDVRVVWVNAGVFVLSLVPSFLTIVVFHLGTDAWSAVVATVIGVAGSVKNLLRWMRTRYRVTADRVEQRRGALVHRYRSVPRDRIRSVDTTAKLRHRIAALQVVHIGSGSSAPPFKLDAVTKAAAERLRHELLRGEPADADEVVDEQAAVKPVRQETVIARFRWSWLWYNAINIWAYLMAALLLWSSYWMLHLVNIDLADVVRRVVDWHALGTGWSIVVALAGTFVLGVGGLIAGFIKEQWGFELVRTQTATGTALLTRHGLLQKREVYRQDHRLRGIHLSQPLFWRWMGLTETLIISTGLSTVSLRGEAGSTILPRCSISEARRVAAMVLPGETRPLTAPLRRHPRGALYRRLLRAMCIPGIAAAFLAWLNATNAVAAWLWWIPVGLFPVAVALAFVSYRSLGHTLAGDYIVLRCGVSRLTTTALQPRAVIGWTLRQSLPQRLLGLMTIRAATAAGARHYRLPDLGAAQAVAFVNETTPWLIAEFLDDARPAGDRVPADALADV